MRLKAAVTAACAFLALAGTPVAASAGWQRVRPTGNDVSYPQCGQTLPAGQAFGIVAVNEGRPNTTNPCLATELSWAQASFGAAGQPTASLYVNTADPGKHDIADWPASNDNPIGGNRVTDPYGSCDGANNRACAWQYGWNLAELDAQTRGIPDPGSYQWWLDVETANSWQSSSRENRADLEGMASYFRRIGGTVGIYSTTGQWGPLIGTVPPTSPLYPLPEWRPGAGTLARAKENCRLAPLTGGGTVSLTQWTTRQDNSDYSCPAR